MAQTTNGAGNEPEQSLGGLARARKLWNLWRNEVSDPAPFYDLLAREAAEELDRLVGPLAGQRLLDLGCGPGYYSARLRATGAEVVPIDNSLDELSLQGDPPVGFVLADAADLPFEDSSVDGVFSSNLLEHTPNSPGVLREISRVLRPGGWAYISWTNWYSPWGGHDISPYHFLGPRIGPELYAKRHGAPRKNAYGDGLWDVHIGSTLRHLKADHTIEITRVEPRYWPQLRAIMHVPGLRELLAWNCVIWVRKL
ncbi:MAG: class I SAM-dependent methyltransferase [Actinomycetes bacterium]